MSPFPLEPPYSRSYGHHEAEAVMEGPLLARSRGMTRWHRVRSGVQFKGTLDHLSYQFWCGQTGSGAATGGVATRDTLPTDGLPICGPCEGKALGAGYNGTAAIISGETLLLFEPTSQTKFKTPKVCPGSRDERLILEPDMISDPRVKKCGACGLHVPVGSGHSRGYDFRGPKLKDHAPLSLPSPCPFHAWDQLAIADDGTVSCSCGREIEQVAS